MHIEGLKQNCIKQVELNQPIPEDVLKMARANLPTEWLSTTTEAPPTVANSANAFTAKLLQNLKNIGCPFDCYGHGECRNGVFSFIAFSFKADYLRN